jgi:hypothetical protein
VVFGAFLKLSDIFDFNLLYNSFQFLYIVNHNEVPELDEIRIAGIILVYFNLLTLVAIMYLKICVINPKCGESEASWEERTKKEPFTDFRHLHERGYVKPWYRRNFPLIESLHNALMVLAYFWSAMFMYLVLFIEFIQLLLIVTIRPFSQEFYMNVKIICRLLFLTEYIVIVLGNLYYSMGEVVFNSFSVTTSVVGRASIFVVLAYGTVIVILFEVYFKCTNLSYQIKVVREANKYKLELVNKCSKDNDSNVDSPAPSFSVPRSQSSTIQAGLPELISSSPGRQLRKGLLGSAARGKSQPKVEIEMVNISDLYDSHKAPMSPLNPSSGSPGSS